MLQVSGRKKNLNEVGCGREVVKTLTTQYLCNSCCVFALKVFPIIVYFDVLIKKVNIYFSFNRQNNFRHFVTLLFNLLTSSHNSFCSFHTNSTKKIKNNNKNLITLLRWHRYRIVGLLFSHRNHHHTQTKHINTSVAY